MKWHVGCDECGWSQGYDKLLDAQDGVRVHHWVSKKAAMGDDGRALRDAKRELTLWGQEVLGRCCYPRVRQV